jgi:hypothetical protein
MANQTIGPLDWFVAPLILKQKPVLLDWSVLVGLVTSMPTNGPLDWSVMMANCVFEDMQVRQTRLAVFL